MLTISIGEFMDSDDYSEFSNSVLYVFRIDEAILYVGQSKNVVERLWQHIGPPLGYYGPRMYHFDDIGRLVAANYPESREWKLDLISLDDCDSNDIDSAESSLIKRTHPALNREYNSIAQLGRLNGLILPWLVDSDKWPKFD